MLPLFEHLQSKCYFMRATARNAEKMLTIRLFTQTHGNIDDELFHPIEAGVDFTIGEIEFEPLHISDRKSVV